MVTNNTTLRYPLYDWDLGIHMLQGTNGLNMVIKVIKGEIKIHEHVRQKHIVGKKHSN